MRRGFRRRKPRVVWLPQPGTDRTRQGAPALGTTQNPAWAEFHFTLNVTNEPTTVEVPLVVDQPISADISSTASLAIWRTQTLEKVNQPSYRLRRIVGDCFFGIAQTAPGNTPVPGFLVEWGIIVRRVDSDGLAAVDGEDQDIGSIQNNPDPWIFRRNWLIGTGQIVNAPDGQVVAAFPGTSAGYGNAQHHIDQKTARRVGPEERLILNVTCWAMPSDAGEGIENSSHAFWGVFDYRVLGSLSMGSGNRGNSTR